MKTPNRPDRILTRILRTSLALVWFAVAACATTNGAGTRVGNPPTVSTEAYPANLAITSPLESSSEFSSALPSLTLYATSDSLPFDLAYGAATDRIDAILNGTTIADCAFLIDPILTQNDDASCYGPTVAFENHPEYAPPETPPQNMEDGELPPGDVGLWTETENGTTQACAAAELNQRMQGLQFKSQVALEALASLICVANVNGIELPESGSGSSLLSEMNSMASANALEVTFSGADLSVGTEDESTSYAYDLAFTYTDSEGNAHDVTIQMTHVPLDDENATYKGRFSYTLDTEGFEGDNNCAAAQMTEAGSVLYALSETTALNFQALHAAYCGEDADPIQSDGLIHADDKFDSASNPDGWTHDFTSTTADFDPTTGAGNYAFAWQAGAYDGKARVFNLTLENDSGLTGTAFFGFGDDIASFDGNIAGFICNWAGPGSSRTLLDYAQRQGITQIGSTDTFLSVSDELNIGYAPTNSCSYDGTGTFTYDSDADGAVDTDPTQPVANELLPLTDADGDLVFDEIEATGFVTPEAPENF